MIDSKVLVTGSTGHLGANLVRVLLASGAKVRVLVRKTSDRSAIAGLPIEVFEGDILQPSTLDEALHDCEYLFHAAALFDFTPGNMQAILDTAVTGTRNVLLAASRCPTLKRIVYTSSTAAVGYSSKADAVRDESDWNETPTDSYVEGKTSAERLVHEMTAQLNLPVVTVNPSVLLGFYDFRITPSTSIVLQPLLKRLPFAIPGGLSIADVTDVAMGHVAAALRGRVGERYILSGDNLTVMEFYRILSELSGIKPPKRELSMSTGLLLTHTYSAFSKHLMRKTPRLTPERFRTLFHRYGVYSNDKAKTELGFMSHSARDVIARTIAWLLIGNAIPLEVTEKLTLSEEIRSILPREWTPGKVVKLQPFIPTPSN